MHSPTLYRIQRRAPAMPVGPGRPSRLMPYVLYSSNPSSIGESVRGSSTRSRSRDSNPQPLWVTAKRHVANRTEATVELRRRELRLSCAVLRREQPLFISQGIDRRGMKRLSSRLQADRQLRALLGLCTEGANHLEDNERASVSTGLCRVKAHQKLWSNKGPRTVSEGR